MMEKYLFCVNLIRIKVKFSFCYSKHVVYLNILLIVISKMYYLTDIHDFLYLKLAP